MWSATGRSVRRDGRPGAAGKGWKPDAPPLTGVRAHATGRPPGAIASRVVDRSLPKFLAALPQPDALRRRLAGMAKLSVIASSVIDRYRARTIEDALVFSFDNGGSDTYHVIERDGLVFLRGFDHYSFMSPYEVDALWPGLLDGLPPVFEPFVFHADLEDEDYSLITIAAWWDGTTWIAPAPEPLDRKPEVTDWMFREMLEAESRASDFGPHQFSLPLSAETLAPLLSGERVSAEQVLAIRPDADVDAVLAELDAIDAMVRR